MPELKTFYFTFSCGFPLADYVQVVRAPDESLARVGMFRYYHDRWCGCYEKAEYSAPGICTIGPATYKVLEKGIYVYSANEVDSCYLRFAEEGAM